eukprot:772620-Rhodomonas_salina.1
MHAGPRALAPGRVCRSTWGAVGTDGLTGRLHIRPRQHHDQPSRQWDASPGIFWLHLTRLPPSRS